MLSNLRRSRRGVATIIAEVMMVLIVILMSAIVYVWVVPAFTSQASKDNSGAAYAEKFETVRAQFANNAVSSPETVAACGSQDTSVGCSPGSYLTCNGSISSYTGNVLVPVNGVCLITGTINGNVYVYSGGNLTVTGGIINGRLEVESADLGQIINNVVGSLDLDANGTIVIAGNTVTGATGCPAPPIAGKSVCYGSNAWCGTGNNQIPSGQTNGSCIGNVEVDVRNTGSTPVTFVAVYMTNIPLVGVPSWQLASRNPTQCGSGQSATCTLLPIVIPVGDMVEITMGWTAPSGAFPLPWNYIYFIFVSSHQNYVDGYLYFQQGLGMPLQSRLEQRICPPCY